MSERDNGGPAFPTTAGQVVYSHGMLLRDWFAGQALAGICAHQDTWGLPDVPTVCRQAYHIADAMIAERSK